jgi:hypothetical protein
MERSGTIEFDHGIADKHRFVEGEIGNNLAWTRDPLRFGWRSVFGSLRTRRAGAPTA